ncbi:MULTISPECIES: putative bifunctional diguanylate cyclase/phosphodiesterase [unclassified Aureimonas]|uniref:putative bifunctional diguanylate cyclase/phosphodiesterase n=1 Tax=unclassified Aureimonas TaxID=2615206 RepID=UPI000700FFBE|nr:MULTISPECIES: EAL domain-containing protein [unclassified Aureimonas]KQT60704.1 hypothetical protein ASG54_24940 [Aureimonas sp. Leaf460]KQT68833.1 hypothetical protein ASG62_18460 [Aureimonas sp. Leaf427]
MSYMTPTIAVILALVAFVTFGINIGAVAVMASQRNDMLVHSDRDIQNLAVLLAKQTDRSFQAIDAIQRNVVDHLSRLGLNDAETLSGQGRQRYVHDMLVADAAPLNFVNWISLVDTKGRLVSSSFAFPAPEFDLRQRDYFKALSVKGAPETFVSEPIVNSRTGQPTIYLARRLSDAKGDFSGILIAGIAIESFQQLYRGIDLDTTRTIVLARADGVVLSNQGKSEGEPDAASIVDYYGALAKKQQSSGMVPMSEDGAPYRTATASLEAYPVLVMAQYDVGLVLGDWYNRALFVAALVILVDLSVLVAGMLGFHHLRQSRRAGEAERHSARHDILTGLPNRAHFQEALDEALAEADDVPFGLVLIDLDNFKEVNDNQGHQAGDLLLKLVSARLRGCLGPSDTLARLGGDEFAIIQRGIKGREDVERLAAAALATFHASFPIRERQVNVGASFGIALGAANEGADLLFDHADMALYQSKALGRGTIRFFSAELQAEKVERKTLAQDLQEAVLEETLQLYYQPIVDLRSCRLTGFEALLRWHDPVRGPVSPSTFIPIAEETGAIGPLGRWVMREACRRAATWPDDIRVAVNLSAVQMQLSDVAADVEEILAETGLAPSRLEIEITESVLLDHPSAEKTLHRLVALGVSISLDDFGTGYSSLSYLCSFPFGRIKIDRSFVAQMVDNKEAAVIVQTVRDLAVRLGTKVTAEGIETHAQLRRLQEIGCDAGQGYLISRPMPAKDVLRFTQTFSDSTPVEDIALDLDEVSQSLVA